MAKKVKTALDFGQNEAQNLVIQNLSTAPSTPAKGQKYFNTTDNCEYYYNGSAWVKIIPESSIDHVNIANKGTNTHAQIDSHIASTSNPHSTTKTQVGLSNVDNVQQMPLSYLDTDGTLGANSDTKVASQKAVKTFVSTWLGSLSGALIYKGVWDGTKTVTQNLNSGALTAGWFWIVSVAGTTSGINTPSGTGLNVGDMVVANNSVIAGGAASTDFNGIDNTESADLVKLSATQTLTNKTINAALNSISGLQTGHFASGVIDPDTTLTANSDTVLATQKAVKAFVASQISSSGVKKYVNAISGVSTQTITAATHLCGTAPLVQIWMTNGSNKELVEADIVTNASGDVTWTTSSAITGEVRIVG